MAAFPIVPRLQRFGGGAESLNKIRTNRAPNAALCSFWWWGFKLKVDGTGAWGLTAITAGTSQVLNLNTAYPDIAFPTNQWALSVGVRIITPFAGVTTPVLSVGDTGNDDEWVNDFDLTGAAGVYIDTADASSVFAVGGTLQPEAAYVPLATLATGAGNLTALTAGEVDIQFLITPFLPALPS